MQHTTRQPQVHDHYNHYSAAMANRLDSFYGQVESSLSNRIAQWVSGPRVLDIGCGFGALVEQLRIRGFDAVGIDMLTESIEAGRQRYPEADLRLASSPELQFADQSFNTLVLKDTIHHIFAEADLDKFLQDARRVSCKRIIVMDPNPMLILKFARRVIGHVDPVCEPAIAARALETAGFRIIHLEFHEPFAFPLSGGYIGLPMVPRGRIGSAVLALDQAILSFLRLIRIDRHICWRYMIVADIR